MFGNHILVYGVFSIYVMDFTIEQLLVNLIGT